MVNPSPSRRVSAIFILRQYSWVERALDIGVWVVFPGSGVWVAYYSSTLTRFVKSSQSLKLFGPQYSHLQNEISS